MYTHEPSPEERASEFQKRGGVVADVSDNLIFLPLARAARRLDAGGDEDDPSPQTEGSERSAEIFLRVSYATQLALHSMADHKSRMLIQLNGVVLSLLLATESPLVSGGLDPMAALPLLVTTVTSMALALIAARPPKAALRSGRSAGAALNPIGRSDLGPSARRADVALDRLSVLTRNGKATDRGLLSGLYRLGEMLESKHRVLRLAYLVFGVGMVITAAGFAVRLATGA